MRRHLLGSERGFENGTPDYVVLSKLAVIVIVISVALTLMLATLDISTKQTCMDQNVIYTLYVY